MKLFTEETGKYQMYIPFEWEYKSPSFYKEIKAPDSFGEYDKIIGAFQLSCMQVNKHISSLISKNNLTVQTSNSDNLHFSERIVKTKNTTAYVWMCAVDDHFILVTYILDSKKIIL